MAHSCAMMQLIMLQRSSKSCISSTTNLNLQLSRFGHVSRSRQNSPFVRRWEVAGLKLEVPRMIPPEKPPKLAVCSLPCVQAVASSIQIASTIFTLGTAFVLPFYSVMIFAPKWKWTKKIMESDLPFVALCVMYIYLVTLSWTAESVGFMFASKYYLPELPGITRMFSCTITVASAWIHLLVADLFCGRYMFLDGLQHKVETCHSLVLCLMMCPIGIISHLITKMVTRRSQDSNA